MSPAVGGSASGAEVTNVNSHGFWVFVSGKEFFLSYKDFPWFKEARLSDILNVKLLHKTHLRWPKLDVDLCLESLENPDAFPLVYG